MLIDWLTVVLPCRHPKPLFGGHLVKIDQAGDTEWVSPSALRVEGSHESRLTIRTEHADEGEGRRVYISGNPCKFFQGHNLFGPCDLRAMVTATIEHLVDRLGLTPTADDRAAWSDGAYLVSRVDLTGMFQLRSREDVRAWLQAAERQSYMRHRGTAVSTGGTVYWGKNSRRWALKAYSKGDELASRKKDHRLPDDLARRDDLIAWADDKLRLELVLRQMELKRLELSQGRAWGVTLAHELFADHVGRVEMSTQYHIPAEALSDLTPACRLAYAAWERGEDVRALMPRRSFYRYRGQLLKHGVDIAVAKGPDRSNVVPLVRVLEAQPVSAPQWAIGTELLWDPTRKRA